MLLYSATGIPVVFPPEDGDALADWLEAEYPDEFCASPSFDPDFLDALCASGFITMAALDESGIEYLVPKMHTLRAVLSPGEAPVTRTARRDSVRYAFGLDARFREVLGACVETHGDGWLRPPLVSSWLELFETRKDRRSRFSSMELYSAGGELVAGEIGVFVGSCYTSLTGFRRESGSGTVQLAATVRYLAASGSTLWDLGMPLGYKAGLGARNVSRAEFLELFRSARVGGRSRARAPMEARGPFPARDIIDRRVGGLI